MPKANVLLSWSKDRSRAIAEAFRDWLPDVVHGVNVWMSSSDLEKGSPWLRELTDQLASSAVGVVFVTPENQHEPWLIYEAGVISRAVPERRCCPILFGLRPTDVTGPLGQFQATIWEKADLLLLVKAINAKAGEDAEDEARVTRQFERVWPELQPKIDEIMRRASPAATRPSERTLLEELLEVVRGLRHSTDRHEEALVKLGREILAQRAPGGLSLPNIVSTPWTLGKPVLSWVDGQLVERPPGSDALGQGRQPRRKFQRRKPPPDTKP